MSKTENRQLPFEQPSNPHKGIKAVGTELFKHLPVWFNVYTICMVAMMAMVHFNPSRHISTLTAIIPLVWVGLYYYARLTVDRPEKSPYPVLGALFGGAALYLVLINLILTPVWEKDVIVPVDSFFPNANFDDSEQFVDDNGEILFQQGDVILADDGREYKVEGRGLIYIPDKRKIVTGFEISNITWVILLGIHCYYYRGRKGFVKFYLAAGLYGFLLESGGNTLGYFRQNDYNLYLPVFMAPIAPMLGWSTIFYPSVFIWEMLAARWRRLARLNIFAVGAIISLIALSWDIHLDPVATKLGLWTWNAKLPDWFLGVPLINYSSWFSAVFTFAVGYLYVHQRKEWNDRKKITAMFLMIPIVQLAAAVVNFGFIGLAEGFDGPTWQILRSFFK